MPSHASNSNVFMFTNAACFLFKLTNWTSWYIYTADTLKSVTLRVYNKSWNKVFMVSFFAYSILILALTVLA